MGNYASHSPFRPKNTNYSACVDALDAGNAVRFEIFLEGAIGAAIGANLLPIVCVGESLAQRDSGGAEETVSKQLSQGLRNLTLEEASLIITAYEPVWAIGTGRTATPEMAEHMHSFIRSRVRELFDDKIADAMRIRYGGSVKPDNIAALMTEGDIDGALVGGASLDPETFAKIVNYK